MSTIPWRLMEGFIVIALVLLVIVWVFNQGYESGRSAAELDAAQQANTDWAQRFTLESQLATRDAQLAEAQQAASAVRTETITKREVIYRDRIKVRTVRDCVADSGVFELYNSTLGVTGGQQ